MTARQRVRARVQGLEATITRADLVAELTHLMGIVERKNTLPVLAMVFLQSQTDGSVRLQGTDLDVTLETAVAATVASPGEALVDARRLYDLCRLLPDGPISISQCGDDRVLVRSGASEYRFASHPVESFPAVDREAGAARPLNARTLARAIGVVAHAVSKEESRFAITGALMQLSGAQCQFVATDGRRLALCAFDVSPGENSQDLRAILSGKALAGLRKLAPEVEGDVSIAVGENHLVFNLGRRILTARKITGQFPDYEKVLPKSREGEVSASREAIASALARILVVANPKTQAVRIAVDPGSLTLTADTAEVGSASDQIEAVGGETPVAFTLNAGYLADALAACGAKSVRLAYSTPTSPIAVYPCETEPPRITEVVMPMLAP